jgi:hypothetical protein
VTKEKLLGDHPVWQEPDGKVVHPSVLVAHEQPSRLLDQRPETRQYAGQHNAKAQDRPRGDSKATTHRKPPYPEQTVAVKEIDYRSVL